MQRIGAILLFYRPLFLWSAGINIGLTILNPNIVAALITKLALTFFAWYLISQTHAKRKLIFYKNLGISTFKLFFTIYIIDALIMIAYLLLVKEFI